MRKLALFVPILTLLAAGQDARRVPVLLELFTSEGCSSCPPADRLLETLDTKQPIPAADLIVLSEHVDYWNQLGWKDPFSSAQYSARQQEYANRFRSADVYTPQLVVDGRFEVVGSDKSEVTSSIQKALHEPKTTIAISNVIRQGDRVTARIEVPASTNPKQHQAMLYAAIADNRDESQVARGENAGHALTHVAVTRVLKQIATIDLESASAKDITLPVHSGTESRLVVFLQDPGSGHIIGVALRKL